MEFVPLLQILVKGIFTLYVIYLTFRFVFKVEEIPVNENHYQFSQEQNTGLKINREVNINAQNHPSPVSKLFDSIIIIALDVVIFNYIWVSSSV